MNTARIRTDTANPQWRCKILGPVRLEFAGHNVRMDSQRMKVALAVLVLDANRPVSVDRLIDAVWGEEPPNRAVATLQVHISNLRRVLGDAASALVTESPGYRLRLESDQSDLLSFQGKSRAANEYQAAGRREDAEVALREALTLWTGRPLEDLPDTPAVEESRSWLETIHLAAIEQHQEQLIHLRRYREAAPELERLIRRHPLRETLWELLIRAHYGAGSASDALAAYRRAHRALAEQLGIKPGERLAALESAILGRTPLPDLELDNVGSNRMLAEPPETQRVPGHRGGEITLADGRRYALDDVVTIGRHPDCTITLPDPAVSRRHAEIRPVMGGSLLIDLSSANGTRIRGTYVAQRLLADGDVIEIGSTELVYRATPRGV